MSNVPEGAQRSEDGHYWWDGSNWQPVNGDASSAGNGNGAAGDVTADELAQIQAPEHITERYQPHFQPDYDKIPDDESFAEVVGDLPEE